MKWGWQFSLFCDSVFLISLKNVSHFIKYWERNENSYELQFYLKVRLQIARTDGTEIFLKPICVFFIFVSVVRARADEAGKDSEGETVSVHCV